VQPELIQIVPPGEGGVVDYLECLKAQWAASGIASHVVVLSEELAQQRSLVERVGDCLFAPAGQAPPKCALVLHYSGYGYGRRGLCFWLLNELKALRTQHRDGLRLVVVFHELFASSPPWRSAFWLCRLQASIAARLARMADAVWTNTEQHANWLQAAVGASKTVWVRPVFSNTGEPEALPLASHRRPVAVVFGSQSTRQRAFVALRGQEARLRGLGIEELIEIGGGSTARVGGIPCRSAGRLAVPELGELLLRSRFGLLDYPSQFLGKSGVFAAYAAHGCVILNTYRSDHDTDRLVAGIDYLSLPALTHTAASELAHTAMASRAAHWYADHRLADQARQLLALALNA
jgi:hypothetical protein